DELRRRKRPIQALGNSSWDEEQVNGIAEPADLDRWVQPETHLVLRESAVELRSAMARLSDGQRLALTLHYFDDLRDTEIAAVMGVPVNTVKSHIHRGKARLLALLEP